MPWIESLSANANWSSVAINEFRGRGIVYFLILQSLCSMAQRAVSHIIEDYLGVEVFKGKIVSREHLRLLIEDEIYHRERWNTLSFTTRLSSAREGVQINQLMDIFFSNWLFSTDENEIIPYHSIPTVPVLHGPNCSCSTSSACTEPVFVGEQIVSGFVLGCFPLESLLRSNLLCLYSESCLDLINFENLSFIDPLNTSLPSRYLQSSTIEELAMSLFVEEWTHNISYSAFFSHCQPLTCTYLVSHRKTVLQIITILLGLYGGLTLILRFIVRCLINAFNQISISIRRHNNIVAPLA
ncbi:unnamed protein product [Rotaria sp. Silwood1]|nr:unnamed protein product [Rotaria sp. Silwood1]